MEKITVGNIGNSNSSKSENKNSGSNINSSHNQSKSINNNNNNDCSVFRQPCSWKLSARSAGYSCRAHRGACDWFSFTLLAARSTHVIAERRKQGMMFPGNCMNAMRTLPGFVGQLSYIQGPL